MPHPMLAKPLADTLAGNLVDTLVGPVIESLVGSIAGILPRRVPRRRDRSTGTPSPMRAPRNPALPAGVVTAVLSAVLAAVAVGVWIRSLRKALHRERHDARHDRLTGLPNRRVVEDLLRFRPGPAVVGLLDLDHLKAVNDHGGHAAGDQLLSAVASRLAAAMAGRGLAARLAGDEFVLLWDRFPADLPTEAAALLHALQQPVIIAGHSHHPTASLGLSIRSPTLTGTDLLAAADAAMYAAKRHRTGIHITTLDPAAQPGTDTDTDTDTDTRVGGGGDADAAADSSPPGRRTPALAPEPEPEPELSRRDPGPTNDGRRGRRAIDLGAVDLGAVDRRAGRRRNDP